MRRLAPLFLVGAMFMFVGCETEVEWTWYDPCGGVCLADEVCIEDYDLGAACYPTSDCYADICYSSDGYAVCTDVFSDPYNCGACEAYCDGICSEGVCYGADYVCEDYGLATCFDGAVEYCADILTDDFNCGGCGIECVLGCDGAGLCL